MLLRGLTVYTEPYATPLVDATIAVHGRDIAEVSVAPIEHSGEAIDCSGMTAVAGLWNCHVHFFERKWSDAASIPAEELDRQLEDFTRYGFTHVFDLSSTLKNTLAIRNRIETESLRGPSILSTGEGLVPPGALPADAVLATMGIVKTAMPEIANPAQAREQTRKLLDSGVDAVKLFASGPPSREPSELSVETMRAAVEEAHGAGKPVFVHPNTGDDVARALEAGADVIAHTTPRSGAWSEDLLAAARNHNAALTPTLTLWQTFLRHDRASLLDRTIDVAVEQLRAWHEAGNAVMFGTDWGAVDPDPSPEYAMMASAGMDYRAILDSLTTEPARRFAGSAMIGRLAPGYEADITILRTDPARDAGAFANVALTISKGRIIYRAT